MANYTKGPWVVGDWGEVIAFPGRRVCSVSRSDGGDGRANARLIAEAPELLEALQELVGIAEECGIDTERARAAIKKAAGQ